MLTVWRLKEETGGYVTPLNETDNGAEYDKILNEFYNETEVLTSVKPYMVLPGGYPLSETQAHP